MPPTPPTHPPEPRHSSAWVQRTQALEAVTGVQLMQGVGVPQARGFWADAWAQVLTRPGAVAALAWLSIVAFFAVFSPIIASGHPLVLTVVASGRRRFPLWDFLGSGDLVLLLGVPLALGWIFVPQPGRAHRLGEALFAGLQAAVVVVACSLLAGWSGHRDAAGLWRWFRDTPSSHSVAAAALGLFVFAAGAALPWAPSFLRRAAIGLVACSLAAGAAWLKWDRPIETFPDLPREVAGEVRATYTLIPFSPSQRFTELDRRPPGTRLGPALDLEPSAAPSSRRFCLGTDAFGQDVLSGLLHACRLSISIGLVSTGIAVSIGVTLGALMGYFGGWIDLGLYRVVEVFMAVPVLFLLIVAAGVLPPELRSTYTMMAIIGCFTWTNAARFTRAEFLKLRNQDFVQAATAVGLPLHSILFKHMLPNGIAPVLVDASFAIAAAISIEATLSFLGLGPVDQASWGKLLASAISAEGQFKWWLAVFPGAAIFLTVLSYNFLGEALRDAIDPKLKKARV